MSTHIDDQPVSGSDLYKYRVLVRRHDGDERIVDSKIISDVWKEDGKSD